MINLKSFVGTSLLLIIVASGSYAADTGEVGSSQGVLVYSRKISSSPRSLLLKSPDGVAYRLSLMPELDVGGHVVVLDLVLQRINTRRSNWNLLYPTGNWHGYQPFFFGASDFARGVQNSIYGDLRVIDLHQLGMEMHVKVTGVNVEPTAANFSQAQGYQFDNLSLQITTRSLSGGTSKKSVK